MGRDAYLVCCIKQINFDREYHLFPTSFDHKYRAEIKWGDGVSKKHLLEYLGDLKTFYNKEFEVEGEHDRERRSLSIQWINKVEKQLVDVPDNVSIFSLCDEDRSM